MATQGRPKMRWIAPGFACLEPFLIGGSNGYAIYGPPPDGQRCFAYAYEADGLTMDHCYPSEAEAIERLEELRMYESRSLMELPDG